MLELKKPLNFINGVGIAFAFEHWLHLCDYKTRSDVNEIDFAFEVRQWCWICGIDTAFERWLILFQHIWSFSHNTFSIFFFKKHEFRLSLSPSVAYCRNLGGVQDDNFKQRFLVKIKVGDCGWIDFTHSGKSISDSFQIDNFTLDLPPKQLLGAAVLFFSNKKGIISGKKKYSFFGKDF